MIAILIVLIALFGGISLGYLMGWNHRVIIDKLESFYAPESATVNPRSPEVADVNDSGSVITPKTPDQLEREADLALRKRNGL